jgi:pyridoxal phosphate enzyme (YggS family)
MSTLRHATQTYIMNFSIADKLQNVRKRIQKATIDAGLAENSVQLLAVSKKKPAEAVFELFKQGQKIFGENYLNEALEKQIAVKALLTKEGNAEDIVWHFIGPIQSNKTRPIAESFTWVHSVDRIKIAQRLNDQRPDTLSPLNICIQVNIDEEETKSGILLSDLPELCRALEDMPRLKLRGLMCIPQANQSEESLSTAFTKMKSAFNDLQESYSSVDTLSMGMSGDMEQAIACGSTMVRVGTALFGER